MYKIITEGTVGITSVDCNVTARLWYKRAVKIHNLLLWVIKEYCAVSEYWSFGKKTCRSFGITHYLKLKKARSSCRVLRKFFSHPINFKI